MVLAAAHLRAGDAKQACHLAPDGLRLGEQFESARCARYLRDFHAALTPTASSATVRAFQEPAAASAL